MLANLMLFSWATLLAPVHGHPAAVSGQLSPVSAAADTGAAADMSQIPLTADLLAHYIAVKKDLTDFWKTPSNKALFDSAKAHSHKHTVTLNVSGAQVPPIPVGVFDYVDLTSREPALAAIFKKDGLAPPQFEATQVTVVRSVMASEVNRLTGKTLDDASSVAGKNVALVEPHKQELFAVGAGAPLQAGGAGGAAGGGGGADDLNP